MGEFRNEIKYICSQDQMTLIERRIRNICELDSHAGADGMYCISSLYFDDVENTGYYENEYGVDPREKFRIRIYQRDMSCIYLECKRKQSGKTQKLSCRIDEGQCRNLMAGKLIWKDRENPLYNKFALQYRTRFLRPRVIVEYERTAYVYRLGNVRITFDRNISASSQTGKFGQADIGRRPVMPCGQHILEVKYDELLPDAVYNAAGIERLRQTAYSKYYFGRKIMNLL